MALCSLLALAMSMTFPLTTATQTPYNTTKCSPSYISSILPPNTTLTSITSVPENSTYHVPTSNIAYPTSPTHLRALCALEIKLSSYSFGLFLPNQWNSRFLAVGQGGFSGGINWRDMGAGVGYGFATMSTDTGHSSISADGKWAGGNEEAVLDWGYRAMHGSIVAAKEVVQKFYGEAAEWNYYSGCSTGGRQGLKEVQMFPDEFDGVLVGAPAWWTSHLQTWTVKAGLDNMPNTSAHYIPPVLFPVIGKEVIRQCDAQDGVKDGIVSKPEGCDFVPEALLCKDGVKNQTAEGCLTVEQIGTLGRIYNDYVETNQTFVFPHINLGAESQFQVLMNGSRIHPLGIDYVRYFLLNDPKWDPENFDYQIVQLADALQPGNATANDFDMRPFHNRGGKLLHYHGLADGLIPTGSSEYFYRQVLATMTPKGIELDSWYRYFRIPGMQHCSGTPNDVNAPWYIAGGNQAASLDSSISGVPGFRDAEHDALLALMEWTEKGKAPEQIIATKWNDDALQDKVLRQRPICPFPQHAEYNGNGDIDDASSWKCGSEFTLQRQGSY